MASLTIVPASGSVIAHGSACRINVLDADVTDGSGGPMRYRIRLTPPGGAESETSSGYSHLFNVSSDGKHEWNNYIFPVAGSWTVRLHDEVLDSDAATLAVTVA
jgi:hypothetical protein